MSAEYQPIDCSIHDRLESATTLQDVVVLEYRSGDDVRRTEDRIADVYARDGAEYLRTAAGVEVRLDDVLTLDGRQVHPAS